MFQRVAASPVLRCHAAEAGILEGRNLYVPASAAAWSTRVSIEITIFEGASYERDL